MIKDKEYIIRIYSITEYFHVFLEFVHQFLLIYHTFFKCHWIYFLLLMLDLYTVFGIALITCTPFASCALNTLQLLLLWENCWHLSEGTVHMDGFWNWSFRISSNSTYPVILWFSHPVNIHLWKGWCKPVTHAGNPGSILDCRDSSFAGGGEDILWLQRKKVLERKISRSIDFEWSLWCSSSIVHCFSLFRSQCVK